MFPAASLDAGLLIRGNHELVLFEALALPAAGIQVQPPTSFFGEVGMARENPTTMVPGTNGILMQPAPKVLPLMEATRPLWHASRTRSRVVSRQNFIGLRAIDYLGSSPHTATHDRDTTVAWSFAADSCERTPRLGLREPGSATTAESAEEKECSAETEEERPIVLGGAFSNLGPWRRPLQLVKAETVVGWQRKGFRLYWGQDFAAET
jgi:hypothetical protein